MRIFAGRSVDVERDAGAVYRDGIVRPRWGVTGTNGDAQGLSCGTRRKGMRSILLWLIGVPIPLIILYNILT
jgi:hypothetical protein